MNAMVLLWAAGTGAATTSTAATATFHSETPLQPSNGSSAAASSAVVGFNLGLLRRTHLHLSHPSRHLLPFPPWTAVRRSWRHHRPHASEGPSSPPLPLLSLARKADHPQLESGCGGGCGDNHDGNGKSNGTGGWGWGAFDSEEASFPLPFLPRSADESVPLLSLRSWDKVSLASLISFLLCCLCLPQKLASPALALNTMGSNDGSVTAWEVRGGEWTRLLPNPSGDAFIVVGRESGGPSSRQLYGLAAYWHQCRDIFLRLILPEGYPHSVSSDYLEYSLWRGVQGVASQISGVFSTQALLYAVGLGKGVIPAAAAVNWVLKDGIGYLSKILLSKYGRHFDVNPKGWRLFADLMENAAYGMEILTPAFPQLFVLMGAAAGASRSAAALIQAATRSCFYAGFATQRNFAEVIAKGEAQGMVSKFLGIMLGIVLANFTCSSTPLALASFGAVTGIHMYCNLKSYQSIQLRTLNPYRATMCSMLIAVKEKNTMPSHHTAGQQSGTLIRKTLLPCSNIAGGGLVFSEYLLSGQVPLIKEVNAEEPLFPGLPLINITALNKGKTQMLSSEAKDAATQIDSRLQLGSKLSEVVNSKEEATALFDLYRDERYMLMEGKGKFHVVLKEGSSQEDMLKSLFHINYLYWLERNVGIESRGIAEECKLGGRLQISLDYVQREFSHARHDGQQHGWVTEGLIARPQPYRIRTGSAESTAK